MEYLADFQCRICKRAIRRSSPAFHDGTLRNPCECGGKRAVQIGEWFPYCDSCGHNADHMGDGYPGTRYLCEREGCACVVA